MQPVEQVPASVVGLRLSAASPALLFLCNMTVLMPLPNRFTENTLQVPRAYTCSQPPRPQLWGAWGTADKFLYSAAQAEENGVSTA